ncbi:glutathione peroxidase [Actinomyces respiraculi]|uniref:glutathione peroxidase n=1 Tax=Actinomyces respiraculi TaxID=2744574 RepID=UPI001421D061|nr:glutathione peroxidase [Actinomyces respiraculi]
MTQLRDLTVRAQDGTDINLGRYEGKVLLIVNTATGCGFTPQYEDLERLYQAHREAGLEILDFPCNQFRGQAPGTDAEIHEFCTLTYGTTFPQFSKVEVNGEGESPVFTWLKAATGFEGMGSSAKALAMRAMLKAQDRHYASKPDIKWNFTKFLVSRQGEVLARFEPTAPMSEVEAAVVAAL